ncbi:unnamed protein product [Ceratitis capitata]|uniref:(Mediterranean fruit fly) hypothetical protein n=1 Tax=Ceratitis capitata TaxID=7213 RepID=A0A811UWC9_CERCA|nr:unnamed protein product [Ceratitis capitata]
MLAKEEYGTDRCRRMHNPLLNQSSVITPIIVSDSRNEHLLNCHDGRRVSLMETQANVKVYALLDEGSSVTLLQEAVGNAIGVNHCHYIIITMIFQCKRFIANYTFAFISLIIDLDNSHVSITEMTVHAGPDELIAVATKLRWVN